ncbi:MAG: PEP-CTERM sorting domain-containing protein, partial [Verrucomicrobiota bacterium]
SSIVSLNNDGNSGNGVVVGRGGNAYLEINDNASIITESAIGLASNNSGSGDVVAVQQNGGTVSARYDLFVGRFGDASYTLTDGTVSVRDIRLGYEGGTGTFTQHGGTVTATGRDLKMSEHASQTTGNGVYNLLGGTLRVDRIDLDAGADNPVDGVFNWGGGTLTMRNPNFNQGGGGTIDYTTTDPINGIGQIVRSGTTIEVTGDMSTATAGISTLDLGGVYLNDGTRVDIMEITGTLDLTGIDHLISVDSPNLLRPIGGSAIDYGSIPLVTATGGITGGSFDTFAAPMADGRPFYASPFAVSDPANLKPNTFFIETTGDTVWFHYKVTGTIPEPGTGMLLGLGVLMARGLHRLRRKDPA